MTMRPRRLRFTIRSLMIAIVLMAVLLALSPAGVIAVVALSIPCACFIGAEWLFSEATVESLPWVSGSWRSRAICCMPRLASLRKYALKFFFFVSGYSW